MSAFDDLREKFTGGRTEGIREKVAAWAFEDAETGNDVIERLESMDCAGCHSPAPIYNDDMAREIAAHWPEIDDALISYRESVGEAWAPKESQNFLTYLWFAYEWTASDLASEIRHELEQHQHQPEPSSPVIMDTPAEMKRLPTPSEIIANPTAYLPELSHSNDNGRGNGR